VVAGSLILSLAHCSRMEPGDTAASPPESPDAEQAETAAPAPESTAEAAQVAPGAATDKVELQTVTRLSQLPAGPGVNSTWGDLLLTNDRLWCVFGKPQFDESDPYRAGALVDLARKPIDRDSLWVLLPNHGSREAKMVLVSAETQTEGLPDGAAAFIVRQESRQLRGLTAKTRYLLKPDSNYLEVVTTWENGTSQTLQGLELGDLVEWSEGNGFLPGRGAMDPAKREQGQSEYMAIILPHDTFVFAPKNGRVRAEGQKNFINAIYETVTLTVGGQVTVERRIYAGDRDVAALGGQVYEYQEVPFGWIVGRLMEVARTSQGQVMDLGLIPNGEIQVIAAKRGGKLVDALGFTRTFTNEAGDFLIPLPEGSYHLRGVKLGHIQPRAVYGVAVEPNKYTPLDLTLGPACRLEINVVDSATSQPIPCKVTFESMINTPLLSFGPPDSLAGMNAHYSATGREVFPVEPGNYRVVVSRGIEYESAEKLMRLEPGKLHTLDVALRRVVPTPGWISVDTGVKTAVTRGCLVTPEERVISAAAEGVEFLISGDQFVVTDLSDAAKQTGMDAYLRTGRGIEIPATWEHPLGLFAVFPLKPDAPGYVPEPTNSSQALFEKIRNRYPGALLTVSRPIFPDIGYYTLFGYDDETHQLPTDKRFSEDYDLLEVWEGKRGGARNLSMPVYWAELFAGNRHGLLADSRSAGMQDQEVGYPRTFVAVSNDDPHAVSEQEITESLRKGRVVLSNGPFIDFKVQGQGPGAMVRPVDGYVEVEMEVWAANWVNTFTYELDQDGLFLTTNINPGGGVTEPLRFPMEGQKKVRRIEIKNDSVLNGAVTGARTLAPIVTPFARGEEGQVLPFAITGPVFVDADGDGKCIPPKPSGYKEVPPEEEIED